jgi:hypothetical protein
MSITFFPKASTGEGIIQNGGVNAIVIDSSQNVAVPQNLTVSGTLNSATGAVYPLVSGTALAWNWNSLTTNTVLDFTGIPATAKRITVMFNGLSTNGTGNYVVQIGSGSVDTTGYTSTFAVINNASTAASGGTTGFLIAGPSATDTLSGICTLTTLGSNIWVESSVTKLNTIRLYMAAGDKTLSGVLDRIRITTTTGTDTFDAGSVNILWE